MDFGTFVMFFIAAVCLCGAVKGIIGLRQNRTDNDDDNRINRINQENIDRINQEDMERINQQNLDEATKAATPFEMGGYDMSHQMNDMNNSMNDFNNFNNF